MKVWWCEEHGQSAVDFVGNRAVGCHWNDDDPQPCRMVEMQLVSADALVIQKVNSEWPTLLIMELADLLAFERGDETVEYHEARKFLDDLAAANV